MVILSEIRSISSADPWIEFTFLVIVVLLLVLNLLLPRI